MECRLTMMPEEGIKALLARIYSASASGMDKRIRYVIQNDQKGLVHVIGRAKNVFEADNFFLVFGEEGLTDGCCSDIILFFKNNM